MMRRRREHGEWHDALCMLAGVAAVIAAYLLAVGLAFLLENPEAPADDVVTGKHASSAGTIPPLHLEKP